MHVARCRPHFESPLLVLIGKTIKMDGAKSLFVLKKRSFGKGWIDDIYDFMVHM